MHDHDRERTKITRANSAEQQDEIAMEYQDGDECHKIGQNGGS